MYLKFVLKETLSVLKSFVLSIFYLAVEKRGEGVSEKMWQSVTMGGEGGGVKLLFFYVTYFLNDPIWIAIKNDRNWCFVQPFLLEEYKSKMVFIP